MVTSFPCNKGVVESEVEERAERAVKFWVIHKAGADNNTDAFSVIAAAYWNDLTEAKFYDFGEK